MSTNTNTITITKLNHPEHWGDWHDKPVKWIVSGPLEETQKFATKQQAALYARNRRALLPQPEQHLKFLFDAIQEKFQEKFDPSINEKNQNK